MSEEKKITITENGPYIVEGGVPLYEDALAKNQEGVQDYFRAREYEVQDSYALCRCGGSGHKPFCDGTHEKIHFNGTETAGHSTYEERAEDYPGQDIILQDDNRCAYARLCHQKGGDVWTLTEEENGISLETEAIEGSWHCPTGRLQHVNRSTGQIYEQDYEPSIIILEDTEEGVSGPLFVRGGIPLYGSDGTEYEVRNRYAVCRCGNSQNKPFCDATHVPSHFSDGSEALEGKYGPHDDSFREKPEV